MKVEPQQLKAFIVSSGLVDEKQFDNCLKKAEKSNEIVENVLLAEKLITQADLIRLKAYTYYHAEVFIQQLFHYTCIIYRHLLSLKKLEFYIHCLQFLKQSLYQESS